MRDVARDARSHLAPVAGRVAGRLAGCAAVVALLVACGGEPSSDPHLGGFVDSALTTPAGAPTGASGRLRVHEGGAWVEVSSYGLPIVAEMTYEAWLVRGAETISIGQFNPSSDGFGHQWLETPTIDPFSYDTVTVTRETFGEMTTQPSDTHVLGGAIVRP